MSIRMLHLGPGIRWGVHGKIRDSPWEGFHRCIIVAKPVIIRVDAVEPKMQHNQMKSEQRRDWDTCLSTLCWVVSTLRMLDEQFSFVLKMWEARVSIMLAGQRSYPNTIPNSREVNNTETIRNPFEPKIHNVYPGLIPHFPNNRCYSIPPFCGYRGGGSVWLDTHDRRQLCVSSSKDAAENMAGCVEHLAEAKEAARDGKGHGKGTK